MDCIYLAFYKGRKKDNPSARLFDRLICWWPKSRGNFSHSEMAVGQLNESIFWCWSSSIRDGGVRGKHLVLDNPHWVVVKLPGYPVEPARRWFELHQGWRYDWMGIFGFVIPFFKEVHQRLFCSESCAEATRVAAMILETPLPYPKSYIPPSQLYEWAMNEGGGQIVTF